MKFSHKSTQFALISAFLSSSFAFPSHAPLSILESSAKIVEIEKRWQGDGTDGFVSVQSVRMSDNYLTSTDAAEPANNVLSVMEGQPDGSPQIYQLLQVVNATEYKYVGCFMDSASDRALTTFIGARRSALECARDAAVKKLKYFGMQDNALCYAGSEGFNKYGIRPTIDCMYQCTGTAGTGNSTESPDCGKQLANAVYEVSPSVEAPVISSLAYGSKVCWIYSTLLG